MNKSKFLKKSLAMLLAVMLVVAMVPLSASAAGASNVLPELTYVNVDGKAVAPDSSKTISADIGMEADTVTLAAMLNNNASLIATEKDGVLFTEIATSGTALTLENYDEASNVVTIKLTVISEDGSKKAPYTLKLTRKTGSNTSNLKSVAITGAAAKSTNGVIYAAADNAKKVVDVTVAYGYADNGSLELTADDNATVSASTITVLDKATFVVTSQAGINTTWTLNVKEVPALTSFSVAGVEGKFSDEKLSDDKDDTITVTLKEDDIKDKYGDVEADPTRAVDFATLANTEVKLGSNVVATGAKVEFTALGTTGEFKGTLTVTNNDQSTPFTYDLVINVTPGGDKDISYAQIENEIATVSGNTITAELPAGKDAAKVAADGITVRVPLKSSIVGGDITWGTATTTATYKQYVSDHGSTIDLTKTKAIVVEAADKTQKTYFISATNATTKEDAKLTAFSVKDGDTEYKASVSGSTITLTVPFMTTDMSAWKVYATPNTSAKAYLADGTAILNGENTIGDIDTAPKKLDDIKDNKSITLEKAVVVTNKASAEIKATYNLVVKFQGASAGTTMNGMTVTAQDRLTSDSDKLLVRNLSSTNTYKAKINASAKTITVSTAYSHSAVDKSVTELNMASGGVAFYWDGTKNVTGLVKAAEKDGKTLVATEIKNGDKILVLPEVIAKKYYKLADAGTSTDINGDQKYGTAYTVKVEAAAASTNAILSKIMVGDTALTLSGKKIVGTIPYGVTVENVSKLNAPTSNASFIDFKVSDYATLGDTGYTFEPKGDTDNDGEANTVATANAKLGFVRGTDNKVTVYAFDGTTPVEIAKDSNFLTVTSEAGALKGKNDYYFDLKYSEPRTDAEITSLKLANANATISGRTINVTVPYGTKLNGLVPTFTASAGADVYFGSTKVESGKTPLDFSNDITLLVTSEDGNKTVSYTVKVTVSSQFTDVKEGKWYYDYVMKAAAEGIVQGNGDGTFGPSKNITRRDFSLMLVRMMGVDTSAYTTSPFTDVKDTDYAVSAIAYLKDKGIIDGYTDGTFKPGQTISREEVAKLVAVALDLDGTTTEKFKDDAKIAGWAKEYVYATKAAGIFGGDEKGNFSPKSMITRAETAKVMVESIGK